MRGGSKFVFVYLFFILLSLNAFGCPPSAPASLKVKSIIRNDGAILTRAFNSTTSDYYYQPLKIHDHIFGNLHLNVTEVPERIKIIIGAETTYDQATLQMKSTYSDNTRDFPVADLRNRLEGEGSNWETGGNLPSYDNASMYVLYDEIPVAEVTLEYQKPMKSNCGPQVPGVSTMIITLSIVIVVVGAMIYFHKKK